MVKRFLFLAFVFSLFVFAGCAKQAATEVTTQPSQSNAPVPPVVSDSTGAAIQDAGSVSSGIEDPGAENQLDNISNTLNNW